MANNYTQTSAFLDIPADKLEKAVELARKIEEIYSEYSEWESFDVEWDTADGGVWIHGDESIDLDAAEVLVQTLVEELELDTTFILTYAETCSKARIDEFAGGGFRVKRGQPIHRISAGWFLHSISEDGQINPAQLQPEPYSYKKGWFNRKEGIAEMLRVDLEYLESFKGEADGPF